MRYGVDITPEIKNKLEKVSELLSDVFDLDISQIDNALISTDFSDEQHIELYPRNISEKPMTYERAFQKFRDKLQKISSDISCVTDGAKDEITIYICKSKIGTIKCGTNMKNGKDTLTVELESNFISVDMLSDIVDAVKSYKEMWQQARNAER